MEALSIVAVSAWTPVGHGAAQTATSIRAGVSGYREHTLYKSLPHGEQPLVVAPMPDVSPVLRGRERLLELALPALRELCDTARLRREDMATTALIVALPADDEAVGSWKLDDFADELCARAGLEALRPLHVDRSGHTGVLMGIDAARRLLSEGEVKRAIVLGVDSYLDLERLALLDRDWRLKSDRAHDGFCAGEAAAAMLLEIGSGPSIAAVAVEREPRPLGSERQSTGQGLSRAIAAVGSDRWSWVACDANGESYRAFEWSVARARLGVTPDVLVQPAASTGDVGAASGAVMIAYVAQAFQRGFAPSRRALVWNAAESGVRAAACIQG
jgi:3-oxoacyl-[acyl-carrier-protein] synthase-1